MPQTPHRCKLICPPVNDHPGLVFTMEVTKTREDEINVSPINMIGGGSINDLSQSSKDNIENWAKEEAIRVSGFGDCYLDEYEERC